MMSTTTPPVKVLCFGASSITTYYNGSHHCGPSSIGSAWCGSATTTNPEEHNEEFC